MATTQSSTSSPKIKPIDTCNPASPKLQSELQVQPDISDVIGKPISDHKSSACQAGIKRSRKEALQQKDRSLDQQWNEFLNHQSSSSGDEKEPSSLPQAKSTESLLDLPQQKRQRLNSAASFSLLTGLGTKKFSFRPNLSKATTLRQDLPEPALLPSDKKRNTKAQEKFNQVNLG